jgi:hypothetical protein
VLLEWQAVTSSMTAIVVTAGSVRKVVPIDRCTLPSQ